MAQTLLALFECSPAPQGGTRVRTPLLYPDGGVVDVFMLEHDGEVCVTDLCEALGRLRMRSVDSGRSAEQARRIEDTCQTLSVAVHRGQLLRRVRAPTTLLKRYLASRRRLRGCPTCRVGCACNRLQRSESVIGTRHATTSRESIAPALATGRITSGSGRRCKHHRHDGDVEVVGRTRSTPGVERDK